MVPELLEQVGKESRLNNIINTLKKMKIFNFNLIFSFILYNSIIFFNISDFFVKKYLLYKEIFIIIFTFI